MKIEIPQRFQGILWSADIRNLDLEKNKNYIIHNVLMYGNFSDIKWLLKVYSPEAIKSVFISSPRKIYTKPIFLLIKNFILDLRNFELEEKKYVQTPL